MKHLDVDWRAVLDALDGWHGLSIFARRTALDAFRAGHPVTASRLGGHLGDLEASGLIANDDGLRSVSAAAKPLFDALRGMDRARELETGAVTDLWVYVTVHLDVEACAARLGTAVTSDAHQSLAAALDDSRWLSGFLDEASDPATDPPWPRPEIVSADSRALLDWLIDLGKPLSLVDRKALGLPLDDDRLADALGQTIPQLVVLARLRSSDLAVTVGPWPPAARRLAQQRARARPTPQAPTPVEPTVIDDGLAGFVGLSTLATYSAGEPLRLRTDDTLFRRTVDQLAKVLAPWSPAVASWIPASDDARVRHGVDLLRHLGVLEKTIVPGDGACLVPSDAGRRWLDRPDGERLRWLVDAFRQPAEPSRRPSSRPPATALVPQAIELFSYDAEQLAQGVLDAFRTLEPGIFLPLEPFLAHAARTANPLLEWTAGPRQRLTSWALGHHDREDLQRLWGHQLRAFLTERLLLLGGVQTTLSADGEPAIALTTAGRYLLGQVDDFALAEPVPKILVQPNGEVVFLTPSSVADGRLSQIAERVGHGVGVLFRIDRTSVRRAAAAGLDAEAILTILSNVSTGGVPDNVARSIRDWADPCRHVQVREAVLIRCPDPRTAHRVLALAGDAGRALGDTIVEVIDAARQATLFRRLRREGIFAEAGETPAAADRADRREEARR